MQPQQQRFWPDPRPLVERLGTDFFRQLPESAGVYLMRGHADVVLYVGKARSLKQRLGSYRVANPDRMRRRQLRLLQEVVRIELEECADEAAALKREAELLRALKPRFNRAGVWAGSPRYLSYRTDGQTVVLAISKTPMADWREFGPGGSGLVHLRAALARLLWLAVNPSLGAAAMPAGWGRGQLGAVTAIKGTTEVVEAVLLKLFAGETEAFATWITEQTQSLVHGYDREIREADLETVVTFIEAKAKRVEPFTAAEGITAGQIDEVQPLLLFAERARTES